MINWSVVTTVKADAALIELFIQHYLKLGASEIFIYLDDPNDHYIKEKYEKLEKIYIQICDSNFWNIDYKFNNLDYVGRPDGVEDRQGHNVIHALTKTQSKWMACVDIDEFIYSNKNISKILNTIPDNVFSLRIKPFEAIYLNQAPRNYNEVIETKYYKHLTKRSDPFFWNKIYGEDYIHKSGFFGHVTGKCFFRCDEPLKWPGLHNFNPMDIALKTNILLSDVKLLHYEALTVDCFINKTLNRVNKVFNIKYLDGPSVKRLENLKRIYQSKGVDGLRDAYLNMHVLNEKQIEEGIELKLIQKIDESDKKCFNTITSIHRTSLFYNLLENKCELKPHSFNDENFINVHTHCDYEQNLCFFYIQKDNKTTYLYVNKSGLLVSYPFNKAMFFKLETKDLIASQFMISYGNGQYFTATPNGDFKLGPNEAKAWELLKISDYE